jgi:competence protein ComEC
MDEPKPPASVRVAPLMPVACAVVAGIAADRYVEPLETANWAVLALGCGTLAIVAARSRWIGHCVLIVALFALAGAWHHWRWSDLDGDDLARTVGEEPRPAWVRVVVVEALGHGKGSDPDGEGVTRAFVEITAAQTADGWRTASGKALLTIKGDHDDLRAGRAVEMAGALAAVAGPLNPGEMDYRSYLRTQGVRLRLAAEGVWDSSRGVENSRFHWGWNQLRWQWHRALGAAREWSRGALEKSMDEAERPLAVALVLGRRESVDPELNGAFARTGTTHLLAISGLHMQVVAFVFGWSLKTIGIGRRTSFAAVAVATLAYVLLVGWMPSVVRSAAMTWTYCLAGLCDRGHRPANTLAAAALVTLGLNPSHLFDVGCQLSFLAVGVIVWAYQPASLRILPEKLNDPMAAMERAFEPKWKTRLRRGGAWLLKNLTLSTLVWAVAVPLAALKFHLFAPVGIVLNLPLIPITSGALLASGISLGLGTLWVPLGRPAGWVASQLLKLTACIVRWGDAQPWGHWFVAEPDSKYVLGFYLLLALATTACLGRWRGWKILVGLFLTWAVVGFAWNAFGPLEFSEKPPAAEVLAVGHGLAVVIETGNGHAVLYDCGRLRDESVGRRIVAPALWARGISRLDAVILSHADADHYNGLPDLLDRFRIDAVLVPEGFASVANPGAVSLLNLVRARGVAVRTLVSGEAWSAGSFRFSVLHPARGWNPLSTDNARSIVLDVSNHHHNLVLTGDLEADGLAAFSAGGLTGGVDVLLSPHHGGRTANPQWLFEWAEPTAVVVSQRRPVANARDALEPVESLEIPVWRTWKRGAIRLVWKSDRIELSGYRDVAR